MKDRVIVITGAFGTLGRAVVLEALVRGATVAAIDLGPAPPAELAPLAGHGQAFGGVDLTDPDATTKTFAEVAKRFRRLDALVNIAGGFRWETVEGGQTASWDKLYAINTRTAVNASRAALPYLVQDGRGRIVNIGALGAVKAAAGMGAYAASKAGVHRLTEALAEEMKGRITVNAVLPSIIDTPVNRADMPGQDFSKWVSPAQLAGIILFLVSDEAQAITGALIPVMGGL